MSYLDRNLTVTKPSTRTTPKDVYAVLLSSNKKAALCISCCVGKDVEYARYRGDDMVMERPCQECGVRQRRLL